MKNDWIVDRIEENIVVLELPDRSHKSVQKELFSWPVKEGDVVSWDGTQYQYDEKQTVERRNRLLQKSKRLFSGE
jgi:hypothetical protein